MIDVIKKLSNVAFQYPAGFCVIVADFIRKRVKPVDCAMRPFINPIRIRIGDKAPVEEWTENPMYCVMEQAIANACFMYPPWFRIKNAKGIIPAMRILKRD